MNYANMLIKVLNDAWGDGILTGLLVIFYLFMKQHVVPALEHHHHNKRLNATLNAAERFAGLAIPEVAKMSSLSNSDRKQEAIKFVSMQLMDHDFHMSHKSISCTVEKIYQYMKGAGHLDIDPPKKTMDPTKMTPEQLDKLTPPDVHNGGDNNGINRK